MLSVVLSVSLTKVQNLAGSKPLSKSTDKLHGWFDCTSLLCWLHCWQICQKRGFLHLLLCIRGHPMIEFAWGRYVYRFANVFAPGIEWHTHHYLCYRNFPNSSDLNPMWVTALTRYWKLHWVNCPLEMVALSTSSRSVYICHICQKYVVLPLNNGIYDELVKTKEG